MAASEDSTEDSRSFLRVVVFTEASLIPISLSGAWFLGIPVASQIQPSATAFVQGILCALPLILFFLYGCHSRLPAFRKLAELVDEVFLRPLKRASLMQLALIAFLAGVGEELLFRGLLLAWFANHSTLHVAILGSSLLFGLAHAATVTYFLVTFLFGVLFGYMVDWTGGLMAPMVAHTAYDLFGLVYLVRFRSAIS